MSLEQHKAYVPGEKTQMNIGVKTLPPIPKDTTDRNRTSPFAFTGNKFEFRSVGANMSIAAASTIINAIVADVLQEFADTLEAAADLRAAVEQIVVDTITNHKRIIFNGNNYAAAWREEAHKRGLLELPTTPDAVPRILDEKNIQLFERQKVYTKEEVYSRYEMALENYCKKIAIEGHTLLEMTDKQIIPAIITYSRNIAAAANEKRAFLADIDLSCEEKRLRRLTELLKGISSMNEEMDSLLNRVPSDVEILEKALYFRDQVFGLMQKMRVLIDEAETLVEKSVWPFPDYGDLLITK